MIRYRYNQQTEPPAPFVYGTFQNPADSTELSDVPAQIDTAADRTVLPDHVVQALGLAPLGRIAVGWDVLRRGKGLDRNVANI